MEKESVYLEVNLIELKVEMDRIKDEKA